MSFKIVSLYLITIIFFSCKLFNMSPLTISSFTPKENLINDITIVNISIDFSMDVGKSKTEKNFSFRKNGTDVPGIFDWNDSDGFTFIPEEDLEPLSQYEIIISTDCEDIYGNSLEEQFYHDFSTSDDITRPTITDYTPIDNSATDDRLKDIIIEFSEPVDESSFYESFSVKPSIEGFYTWSDTYDSVTFSPYNYFDWQIEYTVTITESLTDINKNYIGEELSFSFYIGTDETSPGIVSIQDSLSRTLALIEENPANASLEINVNTETDTEFSVIFDENIYVRDIETKISFEPAINFEISDITSDFQSTFTIKPQERFIFDELYKLKIREGIYDEYGNKSETLIYYFQTNGVSTIPPEINEISFLSISGGVQGDIVELTEMSIIDFSDYNILKASFFDIYLNVSALPVDTEQENKLRMAIMDTFDVTSTNNSLDIIFNGVSINPVTPEPRRAATANEVIIRVYTELQDKSNPGIITFSLNSDFSDHLNNEIISEWNFQIKKN